MGMKQAFKECGFEVHTRTPITKDMFYKLLTEPAAGKDLLAAGVDPVGLVDLADYIFTSPSGDGATVAATASYDEALAADGVKFAQLVQVVLELNERNPAKVKDVIDSRKMLLTKLDDLEAKLEGRFSDG